MEKFKGTQGEWKVFQIENPSQYHTYFKIGNSQTDDVRHATSICHVTTRNSKQAVANAKLIAAAPELLEACIEFVRKCNNGTARSVRSYKQMNEAINKALN